MRAQSKIWRSLRPGPAALSALAPSVIALSGCGPASGGDAEFWTPFAKDSSGGSEAGSSGGGAGSGTPTGSVSGTVTDTSSGSPGGAPTVVFTFQTVSFGGEYAPDNVGAVWVEDAAGAFVRTLEVWGTKRLKYVEKWRTESGGNTVDAVTGATRSKHGIHHIEWNTRDANGNILADGLYLVYIEFTEHNGPGVWTIADLQKGASAFEGAPPDTAYFIAQHLSYSPGQ